MLNIFEQVKSLNLPLGEYAVVGSGVMAAHGIRDYKDIDILVTSTLYEQLKSSGWKENSDRPDLIFVEKGIFGAGRTMMTTPRYNPDNDKLIANADVINGIAFIQLNDLVKFKKSLSRPKDLEDIALIEKYLEEIK